MNPDIDIPQKVLNPAYDPSLTYISRDIRPEWYVVGLLGRVLLLKDEPISPLWRKIRKYNTTYDEWLIK